MPLQAPNVADELLDPQLAALFSEFGVNWLVEHTDKAPLPNLCPQSTKAQPPPEKKAGKGPQQNTPPPEPMGDRWLIFEFAPMIAALAQDLALSRDDRDELLLSLRETELTTAHAAPMTVALAKGSGNIEMDSKGEFKPWDICPVLTAYFSPLLSADSYKAWLDELVQSGNALVPARPSAVREHESTNDAKLIERWIGAPPQAPAPDHKLSQPARSAAERAYQRNLEQYLRNRERARAFLSPDDSPQPEQATSASEQRLLDRIRSSARNSPFPVIILNGGPAPANLFISEARRVISNYLQLLAVVFRAADGGLGLASPLLGAAYGMLAVALVPINCIYDKTHGTCAIESLLPKLSQSVRVLREYSVSNMMEGLVKNRFHNRHDLLVAQRLLNGFSKFAGRLAYSIRRAYKELLETAVDQSGGRVRTPVSFNKSRQWSLPVNTKNADGKNSEIWLVADEAIAHDPVKKPEDIFWMLRSLWAPVGTAAALINQSGMLLWFNAANNRWGGKHPPHNDHRQGATFDIDVGFSWQPGHKVPNVKKRDPKTGMPFPNDKVPKNRENANCLHRLDRVAGWVLTQALILAGVTRFIYGDSPLIMESYLHLMSAKFEVIKPAVDKGNLDPEGHNDHWHFEMLTGARSGGRDPFVWQVRGNDLLDRLYELAQKRDKDASFWSKMAGLSDVPKKEYDFDGIPNAEDWKKWWRRRSTDADIPLLPVWSPALAEKTMGVDQCQESMPDAPSNFFEEGEMGA